MNLYILYAIQYSPVMSQKGPQQGTGVSHTHGAVVPYKYGERTAGSYIHSRRVSYHGHEACNMSLHCLGRDGELLGILCFGRTLKIEKSVI